MKVGVASACEAATVLLGFSPHFAASTRVVHRAGQLTVPDRIASVEHRLLLRREGDVPDPEAH